MNFTQYGRLNWENTPGIADCYSKNINTYVTELCLQLDFVLLLFKSEVLSQSRIGEEDFKQI